MKKQKKSAAFDSHDDLKRQAQEAMEELLQDRSVSIQQTLESMEELETLIGGHIEGLREDIEAGRG